MPNKTASPDQLRTHRLMTALHSHIRGRTRYVTSSGRLVPYPEKEPPLARINRDYRQTEREREDALKRHLRQEREERDAKRKARADSGFIY